MNITETEREKVRNWIEARTPEPSRYMLRALEEATTPVGNILRAGMLVGFDLLNMNRSYLELLRKGDSWYLNN